MVKIAVHLRRCQSTAWTATDCNAAARAKMQNVGTVPTYNLTEDHQRQPSIGCIVYSISPKIILQLLTLTATAQLTPNRKSYQLSKPEKEFHVIEEMYAASHMRMCAENTTYLGKDD